MPSISAVVGDDNVSPEEAVLLQAYSFAFQGACGRMLTVKSSQDALSLKEPMEGK